MESRLTRFGRYFKRMLRVHDPDEQNVYLEEIVAHESLVPEAYDEIDITNTGNNPTRMVYKSAGVAVATINITYNGNLITKIART